MKLTSIKWLTGLLIVCAMIFGVRKYQKEHAARIVAELALVEEKQLNDSTRIEFAQTKAENSELKTALNLAKELNGRLVSAIVIHVPQRETALVHDLIPVLSADSTRTATFEDSTFAGKLTGKVVAPPCCANLLLDYKLVRPAFNPTIAQVKVGDSVVTAVTWQGEKYTISSYYKRPPKQPRTLGYWLEGNYDPFNNTWKGEGGVLLRLPWLVRLQAGITTTEDAFIGIRKEF